MTEYMNLSVLSNIADGSFRSIRKILLMIFLGLAWISTVQAQNEHINPDRGAKLGNSFAIGDFETINTTNGNLMLKFDLGSLPAGRGSASAGVYLTYNSKLYNMRSDRRPDHRQFDASYTRTVIESDLQKGGWQLSRGYSLEVETRFGSNEPSCVAPGTPGSEVNDQIVYSNKLSVVFPDGSSHEMIPIGYNDKLGDRYFSVDMNGQVRSCQGPATIVARPAYYSLDGSYLRLETTPTAWTLYFPDGSRVCGERMFDRNGNYADSNFSGASDPFGRSIKIVSDSNGDTSVISKGVNGNDVVWKIKWKWITVYKTYAACPTDHSCPADDFPLPDYRDKVQQSFLVVDKITQPVQLGGGAYTFTYNGVDGQVVPSTPTNGWGEISGIELPTGAKVSYAYAMDGQDGPALYDETKNILKNYATSKTLRYDLEYDNTVVVDGAVEVWNYEISATGSSITGPDGSVNKTIFGSTDVPTNGTLPWDSGLTFATISQDGTIVENIWDRNIPTACNTSTTCADGLAGGHPDNTYVKTIFTSLRDSGGSYSLTAAKDFTYDKNGNVIEMREYDFMPYDSIPRIDGRPSGLPANASNFLNRITRTEFYNQAPGALSANYSDPNIYLTAANSKLLDLKRSMEVLDGSGLPRSRSEMTYDFTNYSGNTIAGNLTQTRSWDSFKSGSAQGYTNPLTATNSITTSTGYNGFGMPLTQTDAIGNITQITYGNIIGPNGNFTDLYPTQTITAYGTSIARTSTAGYDFYTGLVTTATDADNNIATVTTYDDLGRPTKVARASGTPLECWTQTAYHDGDSTDRRQYILVRSDIDTKGDGRKVSTQFFDQVGRVRLTKTLEDASAQSATNETDGIKVQTRYKYDFNSSTNVGHTYQLTSSPYRASTSLAASGEPTMGWTLSTSLNTDRHSEAQTFSGAVLPTVFGGTNTSSTGVVATDLDANRTLVTDQAGKQRISRTNGLGQLTDVWEITGQDPAAVSVTFPNTGIGSGYQTSYGYDALNNLITVNQGLQTRSFIYSSVSRLRSSSNPENGTVTYEYFDNGNPKKRVDARGDVTTSGFDALNRLTSRSYSDGTPAVSYGYDDAGVTNSKGKLTSISSSVSGYKYTEYDSLGRTKSGLQTIGGQNYHITYTYNLEGDIKSIRYPSGRSVNYTYDGAGRTTDVSGDLGGNPQAYSSEIAYDAGSRPVKEKFGTTTALYNKLFYNSRSQLAEIRVSTSYSGPTDMSRDRGSIINNYSNQSGCSGSVCNASDNNGNLMRQDIFIPGGDNFSQSYIYDSLNRLKSVSETKNGGDVNWQQTYVYDRFANRVVDTNPQNTFNVGIPSLKFDLNGNNQLTVPNGQAGTMSYDPAGNLTVDTYSSNAVLRKYDAENRMTSETQANNVVVGSYGYDGDGRRVIRNVNGTANCQVYGIGGELLAEYPQGALEATPQKEYAYRNGELLVQVVTGGSWGAPPVLNDNPLVAGQTTTQLRHITDLRSAIDSLRSHLGMGAYPWQQPTALGGLIKADPILEMRTALDQAIGAPASGYTAGLAAGQVIKAVHIQELRDRVLQVWNANSSTEINWLVTDQLGTPRMVIDKTGKLENIRRHDYLPFGEELIANGRASLAAYASDKVTQKFTGYERDNETTLDYALARFYASTQGRFTSPDPLLESGRPGRPQSWNRYTYVLNNPLRLIDPTGLAERSVARVEEDDVQYRKKRGYLKPSRPADSRPSPGPTNKGLKEGDVGYVYPSEEARLAAQRRQGNEQFLCYSKAFKEARAAHQENERTNAYSIAPSRATIVSAGIGVVAGGLVTKHPIGAAAGGLLFGAATGIVKDVVADNVVRGYDRISTSVRIDSDLNTKIIKCDGGRGGADAAASAYTVYGEELFRDH